ncbi:protease complex subunit PrcB family protein [Deinococcus arenicola]|uniref:Protease complex subunit PrcB family protein n=1 Tax=Deinococcus arenicola TaxID=2994950 RepID=A0ABU4DQN4_9DEIO|nr:protease complex subunit PrcB family protein [Deinococcus sp. ZS9-10]MDV6374742.1 protease complex subunit PrcB family protein [Deinococcus sp. ZS9-10]
MKKTLLPALLLSAGLFSACTMTGPSNLRVHEALLYGGSQERIVWMYGSLTGGAAGSLKLGDQTVELRPQVEDSVATPGSLSVNGKATYRQPTAAITAPLNVTRRSNGSFDVVSPGGLSAVYYTDGQTWSKLGGLSGTVGATAVNGLQSAGQLTPEEAGVLSKALLGQGPLAVGVLGAVPAADATLTVEPKPGEYLRTALYVLPNVVTVAAQVPAASVLNPAPASPLPQPTGARVNFTELASGNNSGVTEPAVTVAVTPADAAALYAQAYSRQTGAPAAPNPGNGTLVGVFMGQRSTGGYGVTVTGASVSGGVLTVVAQVRAPKPGAITTQAITSPWTIVRVDGQYQSVNVVDESGQPLR